jgi:hypothetical protein
MGAGNRWRRRVAATIVLRVGGHRPAVPSGLCRSASSLASGAGSATSVRQDGRVVTRDLAEGVDAAGFVTTGVSRKAVPAAYEPVLRDLYGSLTSTAA